MGEMTFAQSRDGWMVQNWTLSHVSCEDGRRQKEEKQQTVSSLVLQETDKVSREMNSSDAVTDWREGSLERKASGREGSCS